MAREAKLEAQRKTEEAAKKKEKEEEEKKGQMVSQFHDLFEVIKKAKETKKEQEDEEKAKRDKEEKIVIEAAKKEIIKERNLTEDAIDDIVVSKEDLEKKRAELIIKQNAKKREDQFADQMKNQMMWNVGGNNHSDERQDNMLSKGIGLALLSKILGVRSIEGQFQSYLDRLKKSRLVPDLNKRLEI